MHRSLVLAIALREWGLMDLLANEAKWDVVVSAPSVDLIAVRPIKAGEEVTISYHDEPDEGALDGEDGANAIRESFLDAYGFAPDKCNPRDVREAVAASHAAATAVQRSRIRSICESLH